MTEESFKAEVDLFISTTVAAIAHKECVTAVSFNTDTTPDKYEARVSFFSRGRPWEIIIDVTQVLGKDVASIKYQDEYLTLDEAGMYQFLWHHTCDMLDEEVACR